MRDGQNIFLMTVFFFFIIILFCFILVFYAFFDRNFGFLRDVGGKEKSARRARASEGREGGRRPLYVLYRNSDCSKLLFMRK
jgi:hypothetical protein